MEENAKMKKTNWIKVLDQACRIASCLILLFMAICPAGWRLEVLSGNI